MTAEADGNSGVQMVEGLARGFGGAILFALPLLMTMEMWWLGFYLPPTRVLLLSRRQAP